MCKETLNVFSLSLAVKCEALPQCWRRSFHMCGGSEGGDPRGIEKRRAGMRGDEACSSGYMLHATLAFLETRSFSILQ